VRRPLSFANKLTMTTGTKSDWPYFARWHYRSHHLGFTRFVTLLWHGDEPIGICVFTTPAIALRQRSRFFGLSGRWSRVKLQALNRQLMTLSRVVLHPTYRGAGIASRFIRRSCEACGYPWIETLAQMGHVNPVFERAGFQRVGVTRSQGRTREEHSEIYGGNRRLGPRRLVSRETSDKSRYAEPVYYVFDNRKGVGVQASACPAGGAAQEHFPAGLLSASHRISNEL
jgi:GNAT superfamily N-acetyltransferase